MMFGWAPESTKRVRGRNNFIVMKEANIL
jgi:hypothetical protein